MGTLFAPPEILSALSFAVDGSDRDLAKGTQLRVFAGHGPSFPLAPFCVFKLRNRGSEPHSVHIVGQSGGALNLSRTGRGEVIPLLGDTDERRTVLVELVPDAAGGLRSVEMIDPHGRVFAESRGERFLFSAPAFHRFRMQGRAEALGIRTRAITIDDVFEQFALDGPFILGLPIEGGHPWYLGLQNRDDGLSRVKAGAPLRLNPMDRPDGPLDPVGPDDEVARIEAMLAAGKGPARLEPLLQALVDDETASPWLQAQKADMPSGAGTRFAGLPRAVTLQMAGMDPGLARFFGFADRIDDLPDLDGGREWNTLAVAGLVAIDPGAFVQGSALAAWVRDPAPNEEGLMERIVAALGQAAGRDVAADVSAVADRYRAAGSIVRAVVAVTVPVPPWQAPTAPEPVIEDQRWQASADPVPSQLYRTTFAFKAPPLSIMAAVGLKRDGTWTPGHEMIKVGEPQPRVRASFRLLGHEAQSFARSRLDLPQKGWREPAGHLSERDISAEVRDIRYRFCFSDVFGRFGEAAELSIAPPPRPGPPPPVIRRSIERADVDPASQEPVSPGVVRITFAVPVPSHDPQARFTPDQGRRLGSAILVPAITDLAAGSLPIVEARASLQGEPVPPPSDTTIPGLTDVELALPAMMPQEARSFVLTVTFTDSFGQTSRATETISLRDTRPMKALPTGIGLFWTSPPGPSPDVEFELSWPAPAASLSRVYLTDQHGLGLLQGDLAEAEPNVEPSRARIAMVGCNKVLANAPIPREAFRLLTPDPIETGPDGIAILKATLPRSLETVQFLRIVPLNGDGAEAPFDACGIVPVAVPESRRLPRPRLDHAGGDTSAKASFTVIAGPFDPATLRRDEPGLFDPAGPASVAPSLRLRRSAGTVADPIYAAVVATGPLALDPNAGTETFVGTVQDDNNGRGLAPFVPYTYWAEVRLPPARRLPVGVAAISPPGGITARDPEAARDHPRPVSLPSAPRTHVHLPPGPPDPPANDAIHIDRAEPDAAGQVVLTLSLTDPPRAHAKAVGRYRLVVWTQWPGQPITLPALIGGAPFSGQWPDVEQGPISIAVAAPPRLETPTDVLSLRLALLDPVGRQSVLMRLEV